MVGAADGAVFWAENNVSSPKEYVFFSKKDVSSSTKKMCRLHTEDMSSSDRESVFFTQRICLLQEESVSAFVQKYGWYMGGEGRCPVRFRAGAGMKIGNDGGRLGVKMG